ncbi:MAG TPA: HAMP domain-containing sensor histidine kinase, partial [Cyclobacteriaceae bacterium]|nr:HAMP domain-containing sensor histidine kinase [Cyclobacteriaceae bacterium]
IFEDKGVTYTAEPVDLHQVINQVIDSMKLVFKKQNAIVNFSTEGRDFSLLGGASHLTSVIYNLLDNALKYSLVNPNINIHLQENKETLTIRIQDNGIGIASEYKTKVFEKFFRVPTGDVHNIKGYGLGLSYVDSVIKSHKGTIEVESEPGKGSTFIIRLPKN